MLGLLTIYTTLHLQTKYLKIYNILQITHQNIYTNNLTLSRDFVQDALGDICYVSHNLLQHLFASTCCRINNKISKFKFKNVEIYIHVTKI